MKPTYHHDEDLPYIEFGEEIGALAVIDDKLVVITDSAAYEFTEDDFDALIDPRGTA